MGSLLEIAGIGSALLYAASAVVDGEQGISLTLTFAMALASAGLILLITRRRNGTAWVVEVVLSILWIPYWLSIFITDAISYGVGEVAQAMGFLGLASLALSLATIGLLVSKDVRRWKN